MKNLDLYIKESLLDDIDDLEKESDKSVDKANSIGSEYEVAYVDNSGLIERLELRKLKKYPTPWDQTNINSFKYGGHIRKANKTERMLGNIILGMPLDSMRENEYGGDFGESGTGNEIFDLFQDVLRKDYESTHKFRSREFIILECSKSRIAGRFYITISYVDGLGLTICLKQK